MCAKECLTAQLAPRGLYAVPEDVSHPGSMPFVTSRSDRDPLCDAAQRAVGDVRNVAASIRNTGYHVCRPDVCHKENIGRHTFCHMMFSHWTKCVDEKGIVVAMRSYGVVFFNRGGMD